MSFVRKHTNLGSSLTKRPSTGSFSSFEEPLNPSFVKSELDESRASLKAKTSAFADLERERDELAAALDAARAEAADAKSALETATKDSERTKQDLEHAAEELRNAQDVRDLRELALRTVCDELEAVREAALAQEAWMDILRSQVKTSSSSMHMEYEEQLAVSAVEKAELERAVHEVRAENHRKSSQIEQLLSRTTDLSQDLAAARAESSAQAAAHQQALAAHAAENSTLSADNARLRTELDSKTARTHDLVLRVADLTDRLAALGTETAVKAARIAQLETALSRTSEERLELKEVHAQTRACSNLLEELLKRPSALTKPDENRASINDRLNELNGTVDRSKQSSSPKATANPGGVRTKIMAKLSSVDAMDVFTVTLLVLLCTALGPFLWRLHAEATRNSCWLRANRPPSTVF